MPSQKHLIDVGIGNFASENWLTTAKSVKSIAHSARVTSFCPFTIVSGQHKCLTAFSH
jgi:hypothetical protein